MCAVLEKRQAACRFGKRAAESPSLGIPRAFTHINSRPKPSADIFTPSFSFVRASALFSLFYSGASALILFFPRSFSQRFNFCSLLSSSSLVCDLCLFVDGWGELVWLSLR